MEEFQNWIMFFVGGPIGAVIVNWVKKEVKFGGKKAQWLGIIIPSILAVLAMWQTGNLDSFKDFDVDMWFDKAIFLINGAFFAHRSFFRK